MTIRFAVVPAAYVLLRRPRVGVRPASDAGEVLLQLRQHTGYMDGYWSSAAAGHVEAGESVVQAACRETLEELGVEVAPADLVPLCVMHRTDGSDDPIEQRVDFFFGSHRWAGEPRVMEAHKSAGLAWFAVDDLPEKVPPHERYVLEQLAAGTLEPVVARGF